MRAVGATCDIETAQDVVLIVSLRDAKMAHIDFTTSLEEAMPGGRA
jgi:hypothetical protein